MVIFKIVHEIDLPRPSTRNTSSVSFASYRTPFNCKTPFGYLIAYTFQTMTGYYIMNILVCNSNFMYGVSQMLTSFALDIKEGWNDLKELGKDNIVETRKRIKEYIQLHSTAKQLSEIQIIKCLRINEIVKFLHFFNHVSKLMQICF